MKIIAIISIIFDFLMISASIFLVFKDSDIIATLDDESIDKDALTENVNKDEMKAYYREEIQMTYRAMFLLGLNVIAILVS
jgi:large-conductance mechanosensitive channel